MDQLLNVTTGLSIVLLVIVLVSVRRAHIRVEYSVSWLIAASAMLVLSRARPVLDAVRRLIDLPDTPLTRLLAAWLSASCAIPSSVAGTAGAADIGAELLRI